MTTTAVYQQKPDFYKSQEECKNSGRNISQTNTRYKSFKQTHFTAGDEEQFQRFRNPVNGKLCQKEISLADNIFKLQKTPNYTKYKDLQATSVINTFRYIFHKFKKGIFVQIKDNKLTVFLPFSKFNFINEWKSQIKVNPKYKNIDAFLKKISNMSGYKYRSNFVNKNIDQWYANNCILRYDIKNGLPPEGDTNVNVFKNMLEDLCKKRKLPDIEFFINRRDFPILCVENKEPYNNIWDDFIPLKSYSFEKYNPILSMSKSDKYADILIPTYEDWSRVKSKEGKWFPKSCTDFSIAKKSPWKDKIPIAIFRGSSTGCGVDIETNNRLKLAFLSKNPPKGKEGLVDAGITKWNLRPRKLKGEKYLKTIDIDNIGLKLVKKMTLEEQQKHKYIIHVDGHVSAFRLSKELSTGSVLLIVKSDWKIWYKDMLKPYEHYVPVKKDLSNLFSQVEWCKEHDSKCEQIAQNAKKFYDTYLGEKGILDYMQKTLINLKKQMGVYLYNEKTPLDLQIEFEKNSIEYLYPRTNKNIKDINTIPKCYRSFGLSEGVNWVINMLIEQKGEIIHGSQIFKNKLSTVYNYSVAGFKTVIKTTTDKIKTKEYIHENFIGSRVINEILKHIPNFSYVFNIFEKSNSTNLIVEKISGITLHEYIISDSFNFSEFLTILLQLCLVLEFAQINHGFVHYDLTPWNIILQKLKQPKKIDYILDYNKIITVETKIIPIIIDYGKSHVIYKDKHYGFINMFNFNPSQDILTILITTLYPIIMKKNLERNTEWPNYFKLLNFITDTKLCKIKKLRKAYEVKKFLKEHKRYSKLIFLSEICFKNKSPMDLFRHIYKIKSQYKNFKIIVDRKHDSIIWGKFDKGNSRQIFDYILSTSTEEKIKSYMNIFQSIDNCNLPVSKNNIFNYYAVQKIKTNLFSVKEQFISFLNSIENDSKKYIEFYKKILTKIDTFYDDLCGKNKMLPYDIAKQPIVKKYNESTFLCPKEIINILDTIPSIILSRQNISESRDIIINILLYKGKFSLKDSEKKFLKQNFSILFGLEYHKIFLNNTNLKTLITTSSRIYRKDYRKIKNNICKDIKNNKILYKNILKKISNLT